MHPWLVRNKTDALLFFTLISLLASALLALAPTNTICDPDKGCDIVQHSTYASTLGIKNSVLGTAAYFALIILLLSHNKNPTPPKHYTLNTAIIIAATIALYFIYLQAYVLHAYCKYCMIVDIAAIISLLIITLTPTPKT